MSHLAEIKAQIANLQREADDIIRKERIAVIQEIKEKLENFNISLEELGRKIKTTKSGPRSAAVIKYQKSEAEYWVGRGPKPGWVKDVEKNGESIEQYRV